MRIHVSENLNVERAAYGVCVVRFTRPDLRRFLYEEADIEHSPLFQEIREAVLDDLPRGWTLVVNQGLVERFPVALYRCLLQCRAIVLGRSARLVLCGLRDEHMELFRLFHGPKVFTIATTEAEAINRGRLTAAAPVTASSVNASLSRRRMLGPGYRQQPFSR